MSGQASEFEDAKPSEGPIYTTAVCENPIHGKDRWHGRYIGGPRKTGSSLMAGPQKHSDFLVLRPLSESGRGPSLENCTQSQILDRDI